MKKRNVTYSFSLPRQLMALFLLFVLAFYAVGMSVAVKLGESAKRDVQQVYDTQLSSLADQLNAELTRIQQQIVYTETRPAIQRMELATPSIAFQELYSEVMQTSELLYALQNSSGLIDKVSILLPQLKKVIGSDGTYRDLTEEDYAFMKDCWSDKNRNTLFTWEGKICMISSSTRGADWKKNGLIRVYFSERTVAGWCSMLMENGQVCLIGAGEEADLLLCEGIPGLSQDIFKKDLEALSLTGEEQEKAQAAEVVLPGEDEYLRLMNRIGSRNLWLACYVPAGKLKNASAQFSIWQFVLTAFLLSEVFAFFMIIRKMVSQPINRFMREMEELEKEGVVQQGQEKGSNFDYLYRSFLEVSERLKATLEQTYKHKLLIYQAEIKFLQAQINPHFLYNSFYHLYRMAKMEDNEGVAEMSKRLSSYYRYITRSSENVVPLAMEYQNAADYIQIQSIRFGDRIEVNMEPLPEEYARLQVPRFVLQPLLENAYNHGVEKMPQGGVIELHFETGPKELTILVENNGACTDEELDALTDYIENSEPGETVTALKNVKGRMQLLGGNLAVMRGSLHGFCAALTLPCEDMMKGEQKNADTFDRG